MPNDLKLIGPDRQDPIDFSGNKSLTKASAEMEALITEVRLNSFGYYTRMEFAIKTPEKVKYLVMLDAEEEDVKGFEQVMAGFINIESLFIRTSHPIELPKSIKNHKRLKEISLFAPEMSRLPDDLSELENLEMLKIFHSPKLTECPEGLSNLKKLTRLRICGSLTKMDPEIFQLTGLTELDLSGNPIRSIHGSWSSFQKLVKLNLNGTEIEELPDGVYDLLNLEKLDLGYTKIDSISSRIRGMKNLKELNLFQMPLKYLPKRMAYNESSMQVVVNAPKTKELAKAMKKIHKKSYRRISFYFPDDPSNSLSNQRYTSNGGYIDPFYNPGKDVDDWLRRSQDFQNQMNRRMDNIRY